MYKGTNPEHSKYSNYEDLEKVRINGMWMWRVGGNIFLTKKEALYFIAHNRRMEGINPANYEALSFGIVDVDEDPINMIDIYGFIRGMKI